MSKKKAVTFQFQGSNKLVLVGASRLVDKSCEISSAEILHVLLECTEFEFLITSESRIEILSNVDEVFEYCTILFNLTNCYHVDIL